MSYVAPAHSWFVGGSRTSGSACGREAARVPCSGARCTSQRVIRLVLLLCSTVLYPLCYALHASTNQSRHGLMLPLLLVCSREVFRRSAYPQSVSRMEDSVLGLTEDM